MSDISAEAPFQEGFRRRRWLCSVCERMDVHVFRRVEAFDTVRDTVYSFRQYGSHKL